MGPVLSWRRPEQKGSQSNKHRAVKRGGGYCWLRYSCLKSLDGELSNFNMAQYGDKLEKLELTNLSSMRVSNRIIPPSEQCSVQMGPILSWRRTWHKGSL